MSLTSFWTTTQNHHTTLPNGSAHGIDENVLSTIISPAASQQSSQGFSARRSQFSDDDIASGLSFDGVTPNAHPRYSPLTDDDTPEKMNALLEQRIALLEIKATNLYDRIGNSTVIVMLLTEMNDQNSALRDQVQALQEAYMKSTRELQDKLEDYANMRSKLENEESQLKKHTEVVDQLQADKQSTDQAVMKQVAMHAQLQNDKQAADIATKERSDNRAYDAVILIRGAERGGQDRSHQETMDKGCEVSTTLGSTYWSYNARLNFSTNPPALRRFVLALPS